MSRIKTKGRTDSKTTDLTRRGFVATLAAAAGTAALTGSFTGCAPKEPTTPTGSTAPEEQIYQGVCRANCGGGCRMNIHVQEGKVVKTSAIQEENPLDSRICLRGLTQTQRIYAPERVEYPMRRKEGTVRGAGEWERIDWNEAITYITDKWKRYIAEFGSTAVGYTFGAGTYGVNQYIYMRLFNMMGATQFEQMYDMAGLNYGRDIMGRGLYKHGNDIADIKNSKLNITWGANPTTSRLPAWRYTADAVKNHGLKTIVIDPNYTVAAAQADQWIPIKPGTDAALALAMGNIIIKDGKVAEDYLLKNTSCPYLVKDADGIFLRMSDLGVEPTEGPINPRTGEPTAIDPIAVKSVSGTFEPVDEVSDPALDGIFDANGIPVQTVYSLLKARFEEWPVERAAALCEIPEQTIIDLAREYAEGPSTLSPGFGIDHWANGGAFYHATTALAMISGQYGKPGASIAGNMGGQPMGAYINIAGAVFPEGATGGLASALLYLPQIMETGMYGDKTMVVKSLFNYCGNPFVSHVGRSEIERAVEKLELFIVADTYMTDSARYADIVLPVAHWFEYETINTIPTLYANLNEKAIDPQFECKGDVEIGRLLGVAMGFENMDLSDEQFNTLFLSNDYCKNYGITWETLKEKKHILANPETYIYGNIDYETPFVTSTGRAELYFENAKPLFDIGQAIDKRLVALPYWSAPTEAWSENPLHPTYPLTLITYRDRFKVHSAYALCPWLLEIQPEPTLEVNPVDAEVRGIAENDYVRIFNDRGSVTMKVKFDSSMRPGMVCTQHTWVDEQYKEGTFSSLTTCKNRDEFRPTNAPFDTLVEIAKA